MKCPKCNNFDLKSTNDGFYCCICCNRNFNLRSDGQLVDRWGSPLSIVLYPVIFEKFPQSKAEAIALDLYQSISPQKNGGFREFTREEIVFLLSEIKEELASPTQEVKKILNCIGSEQSLREYLGAVALKLEMLIS